MKWFELEKTLKVNHPQSPLGVLWLLYEESTDTLDITGSLLSFVHPDHGMRAL